MEKHETFSVVSSNSTNLCFSKEEFTKENFSVDSFVSDHRRHATLEKLREDLGIHLRILRSSMVELINQDYADFVNLSTNLAGLDKSINSLCGPLGQLREEVLSVKAALEEALTTVNFHLLRQKEVRQKKVTLQRVREIIVGVDKLQRLVDESPEIGIDSSKSIPGSSVERIATELNQLQFHLDRVESDIPLVENVRPRVNGIRILVDQYLEKAFLENLSKDKVENLRNILRICLVLDNCKKIQTLFLKKIVRPYMFEIISDSALQKEGIKQMLDRILDFLRTDCKQLFEITDGDGDYQFITDVIWPEIVSCLDIRVPLIFSPGNPNHFHRNFLSSMEFLKEFESVCCPETRAKLRCSSAYVAFLEKWNLDVYFQIRFQEIAFLLENALSTPLTKSSDGSEFHLHSSHILWDCLNQCWSMEVFLSPLLYRFWKLTLQFLSRFYTCVQKFIQANSREPIVDGAANNVDSKSLVTNGPSDLSFSQQPNLLQIVQLVSDIELLCNKVPSFFEMVIRKVLLTSDVEHITSLEENLGEMVSVLASLPSHLGEIVVRDLVHQCARQIRMATDIPRLYRKTNREVPNKSSSFVANILLPVETFHKSHGVTLPKRFMSIWSQNVVQSITEQYLNVTRDVLTSVRKMEDSLKRLKRAREKTPTGITAVETNIGTVSDDDKIRLQFSLDVQSFGKAIEALGVKLDQVTSYHHLLEFVESARNSPTAVS